MFLVELYLYDLPTHRISHASLHGLLVIDIKGTNSMAQSPSFKS
jgi:hypothetical protein